MPTIQAPLFSPAYQNVDEEQLSDLSREHIDCFFDESDYVVKRPGLAEELDLGTNKPVDSLFWWPHKALAIAVSDNTVFRITNTSGTLSAADITTNGPSTASIPTFTVGVNSNITNPTYYGILAAGGAMVESNGTGTTTSNFATIADVDAPTTVSHVDFIDNYVVAATGKGYFGISDLSDPVSWSAASIATAMRNPDSLRALKVFDRQIFLLGDITTEIWENDGVNPFSPRPGGFYEHGIIAPNSLIKSDEGLFWLNHEGQFVQYSSGIKSISTPFDKEIANFSSISDCIGMKVRLRGRSFLVFQFPSEERTLVYNIQSQNWGEWRYFESSNSRYSHFLGKSYCFAPAWRKQLFGSRVDSKIFRFSEDVKQDDNSPIRMKVVSGHIDYGTPYRKRSNRLWIRAKRGEGVGASDATLMIRVNDDNRGWGGEMTVSLGKIGEKDPIISLYPRGVFKTRQYEITCTDAVDVVLGEAYEDIEVLGS